MKSYSCRPQNMTSLANTVYSYPCFYVGPFRLCSIWLGRCYCGRSSFSTTEKGKTQCNSYFLYLRIGNILEIGKHHIYSFRELTHFAASLFLRNEQLRQWQPLKKGADAHSPSRWLLFQSLNFSKLHGLSTTPCSINITLQPREKVTITLYTSKGYTYIYISN